MTFKLIKTKTFSHPCTLIQIDESGTQHTGKLKVRFNAITRDQWNALQDSASDDDRLLFDVVVNSVEDNIEVDTDGVLSAEDALAAIRADLSLTGQVVEQFMEIAFGTAAKNARRSRAR